MTKSHDEEMRAADSPEGREHRSRTFPRRRVLVGGLATLAVAAGAEGLHRGFERRTTSAQAEQSVPERGALVFEDDFDSLDTLDISGTGTPKWFTDLPFQWGANHAQFTVTDSVLRINQRNFNANWAISTISPASRQGTAFRFGYFEARLRFDLNGGQSSSGWPAFWSLLAPKLSQDPDRWAELDFFEAYTGGSKPYDRHYYGVIHDWYKEPSRHAISSRSPFSATVPDSDWHVYGCSWRSGRVEWFLDNKSVGVQQYGGDGCNPSCEGGTWAERNTGEPPLTRLDSETGGMAVILGTGPDWPLDVDWVRVWK